MKLYQTKMPLPDTLPNPARSAPRRGNGCRRWLMLLLVFIGAGQSISILPTVEARQLDNLYEVTVPQDRNQAAVLREAMEKILLRLTANPDILNQPAIQQLLNSAGQLVYSSEYLPTNTADTVPVLSIRFNSEAIGQALTELNVPSWGTSRPLTLAWVVIYDKDGRRVVNKASEVDPVIINALEKQTDLYGLPILYPLLDIEDNEKAGATALWAGFTEEIKTASARYQPESILLLRLDNRLAGWSSSWDIYLGDEHITWEAQGTYVENLIGRNIPRLATELGLRFGLNLTKSDLLHDIKISVAGVTDYNAHRRLIRYLKNLHPVRSVQLIRAHHNGLDLQMNSHADKEEIHRLIMLDSVLMPSGDNYRLRS